MIIVMNDDVKELREALGIVRLAPKLEVVMNKFKKVVNERFDGVKDSKALSKKGVLSKVQKKNTKDWKKNRRLTFKKYW